MLSSTRASACLLAVALGTTAAGCGGSSGLSKSALDVKANTICAAEAKAGEAIPAPSNIQDVSQAAPYFDKIEPIITSATNQLAALKPASSVASGWNAFMTLQKQEDALLKIVRQKADTKDASGLQDLRKEPDLANQVGTAATKVGATACDE